MKKYELLEHQADLKIKIFGKTKEQLFANALFAMTENIMPRVKTPIEITEQKIEIKSNNLPILLIDFLNEVLYLTQINNKAYFDIKSIKLFKISSKKIKIKAKLIGKDVIFFEGDIKAATYHNLKFYQTSDNNWKAIVLFDI